MHLLLVGGGHAMLPALMAAAWPVPELQVTLVNDGPFLYYSGMVPEHLGGVYTTDQVRIDLHRLCRQAGVRFVDARVVRIGREERVVETGGGTLLPYDVAAFDVGGVNPGRPQAAVPTKPLDRVEELEQRLCETLADPSRQMHLAIAGGGAAGVEIALNVSGRFSGHDRSSDLQCTVVEPGSRILSSFPEGMSRRAQELLTERGVRVVTGSALHWNDRGTPTLDDGSPLPADELLWATGSMGLPLFRDAGLRCDDHDFVRVHPTLRTLDDARLFAAGDCATPVGLEHLRKVGVHAIKQGPVLRDNLRQTLETLNAGGDAEQARLKPFKPYPAAPLILSTGAREALWSTGSLWLRGNLMLRLKHFVDRRWIRRYQEGRYAEASWIELVGAEAAAPHPRISR